MNLDELKYLGSLGLGGFMFYFYRQDRIASEARLAKVADSLLSVVSNCAAVMAELSAVIKARRDD